MTVQAGVKLTYLPIAYLCFFFELRELGLSVTVFFCEVVIWGQLAFMFSEF